MNIHQTTTAYILTLPTIHDWPAAQTILRKAASGRPRDWRLPIMACKAVGGTTAQAIPASAAIACAQIAIILIDDMLDDDPRGEYRLIGAAQTANFGLAFHAIGLEAILLSKARPETKLAAVHSINQMMLTTAFGQHLDIQNPADEAAYWRVVENKSAPFYGAALHLGALFGRASDETAGKLERIGRLYGEMIQIHDDLNDTMAIPANPDWIQGRSPLPILFAQTVGHPDRSRFLELRQDVSAEESLREAQSILVRCGAVSYCLHELLRRHQATQEALGTMSLIHRNAVESLTRAVIAPVRRLFKALGKPPPTLSTSRELGNVE